MDPVLLLRRLALHDDVHGALDFQGSLGPSINQACGPQADEAGGLCVYTYQTGTKIYLAGAEVFSRAQLTDSFPFTVVLERTNNIYTVKLNGVIEWQGVPTYTGALRIGRSAGNGAHAATINTGWYTE